MKRVFLPLALLGLSFGVSLLVAEGAIRLLRPQPRLVISPGGFYIADPPGRYRLAPGYRGRIYNRAEYDNEIRINRTGLRGAEIGTEAVDTQRLLVLGDSFVFGVGVEDIETFTAKLAERLGRSGTPTEGLNAGTPAFGVPDAVGWLARHGIGLHPDVVILSIFQGNDLVDASPDQEEILMVDGLLVPSRSPGGLKAWLHRHSHLYVLLKSLLEQPGLMPLRARLGLGEPWKVRVLREEFGVYRRSADKDLRSAIEATDRALERLVSLSGDHGFVLIGVLIPSEIQVDPDRWASGLASLSLDPVDHDPAVPTQIFSRLLDRHSIPTLDLGPIFARELVERQDLYYRLDRHWTAAGHAVAAEAIDLFLQGLTKEKGSSVSAEDALAEEPN